MVSLDKAGFSGPWPLNLTSCLVVLNNLLKIMKKINDLHGGGLKTKFRCSFEIDFFTPSRWTLSLPREGFFLPFFLPIHVAMGCCVGRMAIR